MRLETRCSNSKLVFFLTYWSQNKTTNLEETWGQFALECPQRDNPIIAKIFLFFSEFWRSRCEFLEVC